MKRRKFIYQTSVGLGLLPVVNKLNMLDAVSGPYFATGIKIGEVTASSAIVWARLTKETKPVDKNAPSPKAVYLDETNNEWHPTAYFKEKYKMDRPDRQTKLIFPDGYTAQNIGGAVPGANGEIRVRYKKKGSRQWSATNWKQVDTSADYTTQFLLDDLQADTAYDIQVDGRAVADKSASASVAGKFATAAHADTAKTVRFMVTTCHEYNDQDEPDDRGFKIYKHMQALQPDFMVHTGDVVYYDQLAKNTPMAHCHWQRMFGLTNCVDFYRQVPCYFMKDDHDTWMNDCYPQSKSRFMGELTFDQGVKIFKEQTPSGPMPYRTFRWGKHLQIWLVEGREYRTDNNAVDGPDKTIWGKEQMQWFQQSFAESDATYRILLSPTPIVGPDRPQKKDNHANSGFAHEGSIIRKFMATQKNAFIACGDRHWQYVSQDLDSGLYEFTCGPASDEHASGWKKEDFLPQHKYLNIVGGFLECVIKEEGKAVPSIVFTHYSVDGKPLYSKDYSKQV
ncbi:MAG: alkaline phosphatase D family protein [Chitinophagaceae bacterium]